MQTLRLFRLLAYFCLGGVAYAGSLTFVAQPDPAVGGTNYTWFSAENWFEADENGQLVAAGRLPRASETVIITGGVDLGLGGVRVQLLHLTENASVTNGTISVEQLVMRRRASFSASTVNVLQSMRVTGPLAALRGGVLNVFFIATATLLPEAPETEASLVLENGAALGNAGVISLNDATRILGGALPAGRMVLLAGSKLISDGAAFVGGLAPGALTTDNSGLVSCASGTLRFGDVGWLASGGKGEFNAQDGALIIFEEPFHSATGTIIQFTGAGTNRWFEGATVDGVIRVGPDESSQSPTASFGNLELLGNVDGQGLIEATSTTNSAGGLAWLKGDVSIYSIQVLPGARFRLDSGLTPVGLSATAIYNVGTAVLASGTIDFEAAASFTNLADGVVEVTGAVDFVDPQPHARASVFANEGVVVKSGDGIAHFGGVGTNSGPELINSGTIELLEGQLSVGSGVTTGEFRTSTNSLVTFSGGRHLFTAGAAVRGPGTVRLERFTAPVRWDIETALLTIAQLEVGLDSVVSGLNGTRLINAPRLVLTANAALTNLFVATTNLEVMHGPSVSSGQLIVDPNHSGRAETRITSTNFVLSNALLELNGGVAVVEPAAPAANAVMVLQQSTLGVAGELTLAPSVRIAGGANSGPPSRVLIRPTGILRTLLTGDPVVVGSNFENSGSLDVQGGELRFEGTWVQLEGKTFVAQGATLAAPVLRFNFGELHGNGFISGTVINGSHVHPGPARIPADFSPGLLSLAPVAEYQQQGGGRLHMEIGGRMAGSEHDQLTVAGPAKLAGHLEVILANGFKPVVGDTFELLRFTGRVGQFSGVGLPTMDALIFVPQYTETNLALRVVRPVALADAHFTGNSYELSFETTAGLTYEIQATADMGSATWETIGHIPGNGSLQVFSVPIDAVNSRQFYRVLVR